MPTDENRKINPQTLRIAHGYSVFDAQLITIAAYLPAMPSGCKFPPPSKL